MVSSKETSLTFPCEFSIKAFGRQTPNLVGIVTHIVAKHVDVRSNDITSRKSKNASYVSVTIKITATDKEQLDRIYLALSEHPDILMTL